MTGSAPRHLVVRVDGLVLCPEGSRAYQDCFRCPALQGTLEGAELVMLCGHGAPAPPLRFAAVTMDRPVPLADAPVPAHRR